MTLSLIAAVARNGVIGDGGRLLWHLPEDLAFFRRTTMDRPVLMGRRTWDGLPTKFRPLPGRRNIVVSRQRGWHADGAEHAGSLDDALALVGNTPEVFVIGGGELYALALPRADELLITEIDRDFDGDTRFPGDRADFVEVGRQAFRAAPPNDFDVAFVRWQRRR